MLTDTSDDLRKRLDTARRRERESRAIAAKISREMAALDRRREAQRLCTLGRAWETWAEHTPSFRDAATKFLAGYLSRQTDIDIMRGTPWERPEQPPEPLPHEDEDHAG
jgi:hypothetical protein